MDLGLKDKVILITGAASGMGEASAKLLIGTGAKLVLADINTQGLAAVTRHVKEAGTDAIERALDVSSPEEASSVTAAAVEKYGRIDGLLHFAGIIDTHPLEDITVEQWNRVISINLLGTLLMVQAVAPVMRKQGRGRIVLTASDSARKGASVSGPAYAASKGGVIALTRDFAMKLGPAGINVNAICPGIAITPMVTNDIRLSQTVIDEITSRTPLGRIGQPDDMAGVAIMLLSDAAKFVNGEIVEVNGGFFFD